MRRAPALERFGKPTSNTIPTIVRGYKFAVTNQINIIRRTPGLPVWQRNYYERVIRDEKELFETRQYIINNLLNWEMDENYC
jgi:putative transposase